jgi:hypothetical protein
MNELVENSTLEDIKHLHGFDKYIADLIESATTLSMSIKTNDIDFWVREVRARIDSRLQQTAKKWGG